MPSEEVQHELNRHVDKQTKYTVSISDMSENSMNKYLVLHVWNHGQQESKTQHDLKSSHNPNTVSNVGNIDMESISPRSNGYNSETIEINVKISQELRYDCNMYDLNFWMKKQ